MHFSVKLRILAILAVTQIVSWGSLYYGITILGPAIVHDMGWRNEVVYGAYSWSLVLSGLVLAPAGAWLDRRGGRLVMGAGSLAAAAGMTMLALSHSLWSYFLAWSVMGLAMALTLYEAAFATINRELGLEARQAISTLTLFGGFASTVFWPLTMRLQATLGWRDTCLVYAAMHLLLCLPLHGLLPVRTADRSGAVHQAHADLLQDATLHEALRHATFWKLAFAFAVNALIFAAMAVHLIPLLTGLGYSPSLAVGLAALIGPAQVAGRVAERLFFHQAPPQLIGRAAFACLPFGLLAVLLWSQQALAVAAFCLVLGASNGILTIVRGALPQLIYGRTHYGAIAGALAAPSIGARAAGPLLAAALLGAGIGPDGLLGVLLAVSLLSALSFMLASAAGSAQRDRGAKAVLPHP
jgi:hypothetical protein